MNEAFPLGGGGGALVDICLNFIKPDPYQDPDQGPSPIAILIKFLVQTNS